MSNERTKITFDLPKGVTLAHVLGSTPSDRAETYVRALMAAARDLGLPKPPPVPDALTAWLRVVLAKGRLDGPRLLVDPSDGSSSPCTEAEALAAGRALPWWEASP